MPALPRRRVASDGPTGMPFRLPCGVAGSDRIYVARRKRRPYGYVQPTALVSWRGPIVWLLALCSLPARPET
jgi:hypothetical protein